MKSHRKAKIVATVGPASASPEMLSRLLDAGVSTFRLNFSHGTHAEHKAVIQTIRGLEEVLKRPIGIIQDLQGPKIRLGRLRSGGRAIETGSTVRLIFGEQSDQGEDVLIPHLEVLHALRPGDRILINDGRVCLQVLGLADDHAMAIVRIGGWISDRKGINLPDTQLELSPLTAKDRADLQLGLSLGVDWIALSFVQKPGDLLEARALINDRAGLIAKIEKPSALRNIDDIIALADGIMVARGDLGVEIPAEDVPMQQKELVRACRRAAIPVIVATQMLESMTGQPTPTRAEASDVATAICEGADAVMLSAESASGAYPREAVDMMDRIIRRTESHPLYQALMGASDAEVDHTASHAIAESAAELAASIGSPVITAFTSSGTTVARIARRRAPTPILAITPNLATLRRLTLYWGVQGVLSEDIATYEDMVQRASELALAEGCVASGDTMVVVAGIPFAQRGTTNNLRVVHVGR